MRITPEDYAKFMMELINRYKSEDEADPVKEMFKRQDSENPECHYSLGLGIVEQQDYIRLAHTGGIDSGSTAITIFPKEGRAAVVMVNGGECSGLTWRIMSGIDQAYGWNSSLSAEVAVLSEIPEENMAQYIGDYQFPMGDTMRIFKSDKNLTIELTYPNPDSPKQQFKLFQDKHGNIFDENFKFKLFYDPKTEQLNMFIPKEQSRPYIGKKIELEVSEKTSAETEQLRIKS